MNMNSANVLWLGHPTCDWEHAFPIGNGALGAMVFGGVAHERLQLNEETVWAGGPRDTVNPKSLAALPRVRELLFNGQSQAALELADETMVSIPKRIQPYQSLGDLWLDFDGHEYYADYRRELDLDNAVTRVSYRIGQTQFSREAFVSAPDGVLALRLQSDDGVSLNLKISRQERASVETLNESTLRLSGSCPGAFDNEIEEKDGVRFEALLRVAVEGGSTRAVDNGLRIEGAQSVTILLAAATNYREENPREICEKRIAAAAQKSYDELRANHIADYRTYFGRVEIELGETSDEIRALATDKRIERVRQDKDDAALYALYFQFARYLLISSSRPGTLPANLQGIWADGLNPPWESDFHLNINLQMNYWLAEATNLAECHAPLFDFLEMLTEAGRETARRMYDCRGSMAHHLTDAWGFTTPADSARYGLWPMGLAWTSAHLWQHFLFGGDKEFLRATAYPILRECGLFFLDYLVENDKGELVCGPSMSPENFYFLPNGDIGFLCMGATMDSQIVRELFANCVAASELLDCDEELRDQWRAASDKLPANRIGKHGQLMEWSEDYDEPEPGHRHVSHLYGLHPSNQITVESTPELAAAARKTLERRLAHGGGHTGWSRAWIVNFFARLRDGEQAYENLRGLLSRSTLPNLLDTHPPFQIDGNFGGASGITEMLLQSHESTPTHAILHLLPALPEAWSSGQVRGLRAAGGFEVDMEWSGGVLLSAKLRASRPISCEVRVGDGDVAFEMQGGSSRFEASVGQEYSLRGG
jgi:alpha-L-fucosidase 2